MEHETFRQRDNSTMSKQEKGRGEGEFTMIFWSSIPCNEERSHSDDKRGYPYIIALFAQADIEDFGCNLYLSLSLSLFFLFFSFILYFFKFTTASCRGGAGNMVLNFDTELQY